MSIASAETTIVLPRATHGGIGRRVADEPIAAVGVTRADLARGLRGATAGRRVAVVALEPVDAVVVVVAGSVLFGRGRASAFAVDLDAHEGGGAVLNCDTAVAVFAGHATDSGHPIADQAAVARRSPARITGLAEGGERRATAVVGTLRTFQALATRPGFQTRRARRQRIAACAVDTDQRVGTIVDRVAQCPRPERRHTDRAVVVRCAAKVGRARVASAADLALVPGSRADFVDAVQLVLAVSIPFAGRPEPARAATLPGHTLRRLDA